jgi:hypothetical protein
LAASISWPRISFTWEQVGNRRRSLLARWLLMCKDRLAAKSVPLTHQFLSMMLGVQRSGVTIALGELEDRDLIRTKRGMITILDRPSLMKLTNGSYGVAEAEYQRRFETKQH